MVRLVRNFVLCVIYKFEVFLSQTFSASNAIFLYLVLFFSLKNIRMVTLATVVVFTVKTSLFYQ